MQVWLVEDNDELRTSLERALAGFRGVAVSGCFALPSACLDAVARGERCDVALVDLGLPEMSGVELIAALSRSSPAMALIALTVCSDDRSLFGALRAGAVGYLLKDVSLSELEGAIALAFAGGSPLSPEIGRRVVRALGDGGRRVQNLGLTPREAFEAGTTPPRGVRGRAE